MPRIVGTGLVALDLIVEHDEAGTRTSASGGGTCGNVLAILARLGWQAQWLGGLGASDLELTVGRDLAAAGVDVAGAGAWTPVAAFAHHVRRLLDHSSEHWFSTDCPCCQRALPRYARPADRWLRRHAGAVERCDVFFADRLSAATLELAVAARRTGALIVYEPSVASDAPWIEPMLELADVVKYSHERADALGAHRAGRRDVLWIETHGRHGVRWSRRGREGAMHHVDAVPGVTVRDACGAGDWFTSALLHQLGHCARPPAALATERVQAMLVQASQVAAWSCGFLGARGALYDAAPDALGRELGLSGFGLGAGVARPVPPPCLERAGAPSPR